MFKTKFVITASLFIVFLIITSFIKNKTRILEKKISNLNTKILIKKKDINETQLDFYYLTSPSVIEKKIKIIGLNNYQPITPSKIYLKIADFDKIQNRVSHFKNTEWKKNIKEIEI